MRKINSSDQLNKHQISIVYKALKVYYVYSITYGVIKMLHTQEFTPTQLKKNSSEIFNTVQSSEMVLISSKTRPCMVLMTLENYELAFHEKDEKIRQLTEAVKKLSCDAHLQQDVLKG